MSLLTQHEPDLFPASPVCRKFNDEEAIFPVAATSPCESIHGWYNRLR
jgi:hypothetical protein